MRSNASPVPALTIFLTAFLTAACGALMAAEAAQLAPVFSAEQVHATQSSPLKSYYLPVTRVLWESDAGVENAKDLLKPHPGQAVLSAPVPPCVLTSKSNSTAGLLLDFEPQPKRFNRGLRGLHG